MYKKTKTDIDEIFDDFMKYGLKDYVEESTNEKEFQQNLDEWDSKNRLSNNLKTKITKSKKAKKIITANKRVLAKKRKQELNKITTLRKKGISFGEIAKKLKRTYWSIYNQFSRQIMKRKR